MSRRSSSGAMRILIFEAITGGGLAGRAETPDGSLLNEGLGMIASVCADLASKQNSPMQQWLGEMLGPCTSRQVSVLWDNRLAKPQIETQSSAFSDNLADPITLRQAGFRSCEINHSAPIAPITRQIHSLDLQKYTTTHSVDVHSHTESWDVPLATRSAATTFPQSIQFISVSPGSSAEDILLENAADFDRILLIAPEPTLSGYSELLHQWSDRLFNLPTKLLQYAQEKTNYTSLPFMLLRCANGNGANGNCVIETQERELDWLSHQSYVIKPVNSCGATNTYRLEFGSANVSLTQMRQAIDNLLRQGKIDSAAHSTYMVMPWVNGVSVSVSFLATGKSLFQFPACEQRICLAEEMHANEGEFKVAKIEYLGSRWADLATQAKVESRVPEILGQLIAPAFYNRLRGWFGVDLVIDGCSLELLDFNGRWTSSYGLLRQLQSSGHNAVFRA